MAYNLILPPNYIMPKVKLTLGNILSKKRIIASLEVIRSYWWASAQACLLKVFIPFDAFAFQMD